MNPKKVSKILLLLVAFINHDTNVCTSKLRDPIANV